MTGEHILFATEGRPGPYRTDLDVPLPGRHAIAEAAERHAAALTICARARSKADAVLLLSACGLPGGAP